MRFVRLCAVTLLLVVAVVGTSARAVSSYPTATLTVNGSEQSGDGGTLQVDFNGYLESVSYGTFSTSSSIASALAAMFSRDYIAFGLYAKAGANGNPSNVITFQLINGSLFQQLNVSGPTTSFSFAGVGFGIATAGTPDVGTVSLLLNGAPIASTTYGDGSTPATIAEALAEKSVSSLVTVTAQGPGLYLQSRQSGAFSDSYSLQFSPTAGPTSPFASAPSSGTLTGSSEISPVTLYSYSVTEGTGQSGYDASGNLVYLNDSIMGNWSYGYDTLNRLTSGISSVGTYAGQTTCWTYDDFGNRTFQSVSTTPCADSPSATFSATYNSNNQVSSVTSDANINIRYDAAGNVTNDGQNQYIYDAEGRVCAVNGPEGMVGYQYNAEGKRVGKGVISTMTCDVTQNGYHSEADFILDEDGSQMSEVGVVNGTLNWRHSTVTANGMLIGSYDSNGLHLYLGDLVGSRRVQTDALGIPEQVCQNLPFGDRLYCTGSLTSPTEHHFTGKERDTESGNDYFGVRYYSSSMGRFSSPDPSGLEYVNSNNPQSLNLYTYALNNPLRNTDPTGMYCDYSDHNDPRSGFDPAQFDYGSSEGECTAADENGNRGVWVADAATHQDANGQGIDDEGRPDSPVSSNTDSSSVKLDRDTNDFSFSNMTQEQVIKMLQNYNVVFSPADTLLSKVTKAHPGINMRSDRPICSIHLNITPGSGRNGKPVTGNFHYDLFSPLLPSTNTVFAPSAAAHAAADVIPDLLRSGGYTNHTGNQKCDIP